IENFSFRANSAHVGSTFRGRGCSDGKMYLEDISWAYGFQPANFIKTWRLHTHCVAEVVIDKEAHKYRGSVPSACYEATKHRILCPLRVNVKRLWIILSGKVDDLFLRHFLAAEVECVTDVEIFEIAHVYVYFP